MSARDRLRADDDRRTSAAGRNSWNLPESPPPGDTIGACEWLTTVFQLDPRRPVVSAERQGRAGTDCHVSVKRLDAPEIRFEPITCLSSPRKMVESLEAYTLPSDGAAPPITAAHCRIITRVVRMLCGSSELMTAAEEAAGIVSAYLASANAIEGCRTHGTGGQRYEAAASLRQDIDPASGRPIGPPRYLIDVETSEIIVGVSDLNDAARRYVGSSLARGWLDARLAALGWDRVTLDGHALPGRSGRQGPHARISAYRGAAPQGGVTT